MPEMTSRQRLLAAMRREQPDRVPIHVRGVPAWNEEWVRTRHPSYAPVIEAVARHGDLVATWSPPQGFFLSAAPLETETTRIPAGDWDIQRITLRTPLGPLTHERHISRSGMPGLTTRFWIETLEDVERFLSLPYEPVKVDAAPFFELERQLGERALVITGLNNPATYTHMLLGSERLAIWSIEERALISRLMGLFAERVYDLVRALLEANVRGVFGFTGEEYIGPPLQSPRDFREWGTCLEQPIAELLHRYGCLMHIHCHGPMDAILEEFPAIGCDCLHPIEAPPLGDVPLADAKRRIGDRVCLEGNVQIGDLYSLTPPEIRELVRHAIDDGAPGGGFILCPTASPFTPTLEPKVVENYLAFIEAGVEWGRA